jgi:hypothetical protein
MVHRVLLLHWAVVARIWEFDVTFDSEYDKNILIFGHGELSKSSRIRRLGSATDSPFRFFRDRAKFGHERSANTGGE